MPEIEWVFVIFLAVRPGVWLLALKEETRTDHG